MAMDDHQHENAEDVGARKRALRQRVLAARDALPDDERAERSARITAQLFELVECTQAHTVMAYASVGSEFDTAQLLERLLAAGVVVGLPRIVAPRVMDAVRVTDLDRDLVPGRFRIPAPREGLETLPPAALDCVLTPGVAFDLQGQRCGYGGGFYDALLAKTRPGCHRVAPAFEAQLVAEVLSEPHDLPVHLIVTEDRVVDVRG
jgi:5-formyltetrahydrofolate cyclo-ligase